MKEKNSRFKIKMSKKTLIGAVSIIMALLLTYVLAPLYNKTIDSKGLVVRVTKEIAQGDKITSSDIEEIEVGNYNLSDKVLTKKEDVLDKYATAYLGVGDYILESKLSDIPVSANTYLWDVDEERSAISITIKSFASGLSGKLEPGDIVSIISADNSDNYEDKSTEKIDTAVIPEELKYVEILSVTAGDGKDVDAQLAGKKTEDSDQELAQTVTLAVNNVQGQKLAFLEQNNNIHVLLVSRGNSDTKDNYLTLQNDILLKLKEGSTNEEVVNSEQVDEETTEGETKEMVGE